MCDRGVDNFRTDSYNYAYKKHKYKERGSASGVKTALLADVFNSKLETCLIAEDGFMLGAVILKGPANVLHKTNESHIGN